MALIQCGFYSEALQLNVSTQVLLPQKLEGQVGRLPGEVKGGTWKTLWLLHGMSDDETTWVRRTSIERYAGMYGVAVVMPAVNRSYYADMAHGLKYWTYISEELPRLMRSYFPLALGRENNFAAGLSMGGYGAFKLALNFPEQFCAAASLSGALDPISEALIKNASRNEEMKMIFGSKAKVTGSENDLFHLARKVAKSKGPKPRLFQCCGTEDFLYKDNLRFRDEAKKLKLDLTYTEGPGSHEWGYWDARIQDALRFFFRR